MKGGQHFIGMRNAEGFALLRPKNLDALRPLFADKPPLWHTLDVAISSRRDPGSPPLASTKFASAKNPMSPIGASRRKPRSWSKPASHNFAFFLNPTQVEEVRAIADARSRMPQKSTAFLPEVTFREL